MPLFLSIVLLAEVSILYLLSRFSSQSLFTLFHRLTRSEVVSMQLLSVCFLPGTIFHEVSHYIMAKVLFVPTGNMELMPKRDGNHIKLGSVAIATTDPIRRAFIGLAPIILGITGIFLIGMTIFHLPDMTFFQKEITHSWVPLIWFLLLFEISNTMFSSRKDLEGFGKLLFVIAFLGSIFYGVVIFLGISLPAIPQAFITGITPLAINLALSLGVVVVFNSCVGLLFKLILR